MTVLDLRQTYKPHTEPFPHQWEALQVSYNKRSFAWLMDPGLGKTKLALDNSVILFEAGHIRGLLVAAPNDVHEQWRREQIPEHLPPRVRARILVWDSRAQARMKRELAHLCTPIAGHLQIFLINHEAFATSRGTAAARRFLKAYPCLFALDDSHEFRTPKAKRTRALGTLRDLAFARRIMTGTLTGGTPLHLYSQFNFLDPRILKCDSYLTFKHRYAEWAEQMILSQKVDPRTGKRKPQVYETLIGYKDLDELNARIAPFVYSRKKEQCEGLPPKLYEVVPTHLSAAQIAVYEALVEQGLLLLQQNEVGKPIQVSLLDDLEEDDILTRVQNPNNRMSYRIKLTMWLRLQQCTAGILKDDAGTISIIDGSWDKCPRMQAAIKWVEQALTSSSKVIIWANFRPVLAAISASLLGAGIANIMVHGGVTGRARAEAIALFKEPLGPRVLVAHPRTLGTGQNFEIAQYVLYFTRSFSYFQRHQSEDRAHRLSSKGTVTIGDLIAHNSGTDEKELVSLRAKEDVVRQLETFDMRNLLQC